MMERTSACSPSARANLPRPAERRLNDQGRTSVPLGHRAAKHREHRGCNYRDYRHGINPEWKDSTAAVS